MSDMRRREFVTLLAASANSVSLTHALEKRSTLRWEPKRHTVSSASSYRATSAKVTANEFLAG
jgi:hypothetical protein